MRDFENNRLFLGIDVGSISTNLVLLDEQGAVAVDVYLRTGGNPLAALREGLGRLASLGYTDEMIIGCGATGSARRLIGVVAGCDIVKNEITAHARAALSYVPDARTVVEIGGQDSKLIILRNGVAYDFAMNNVCAAGTGAFLDAQAARLGVPIERFGELALKARGTVSIAGRCTVFAESDMIHKQQMGHSVEDIINGLCRALIRNYLGNVAQGKRIHPPVVFQGGVSENRGIRRALEDALECDIIVPPYNKVMGAIGVALLVKRELELGRYKRTSFRGLLCACDSVNTSSFVCAGCPNQCDVVEVRRADTVAARWNDRCGKWQRLGASHIL